jgi:osmotically-inducible protein OsmY
LNNWHDRCYVSLQEKANNIMTRTTNAAVLALLIALCAFSPVASAASPEALDLTPKFRSAGVSSVERLQVYEIAGIVLIRGRVADKAQAEEVGRIAQTLGYERVANLIQIVEHRDEEITRRAEVELTVNRSLDGCKFQVTSQQGNVRVAGQVKHELQKDVAAQVLRNIDGIRSVEFALNRF